MLVADNISRRAPDADDRGDQRVAAQGSLPRARRHQLPQRRPRLGATRRSQQLEADIKAGAIGVGEVGKQFGLRTTKPDGSRLKVDDPELDPLWDDIRAARCAGVHSHRRAAGVLPAAGLQERAVARAVVVRGSPQQPAGPGDVRAVDDRAQQRLPQASEDALRRARISAGTPTTCSALGKLLDEFPNVTIEAGAILYDLGRQPRAAHDFFVKYQDRIMFGKDSFQPEEYPVLLARVRDRGRVLRLLPRLPRVLEAVRDGAARRGAEEGVLQDALRVFKGLPQTRLAAVAAVQGR